MTDEDDEQMRIVFEDGTSEECSPADQRQISTVAVFHPAQRIPKNLKRWHIHEFSGNSGRFVCVRYPRRCGNRSRSLSPSKQCVKPD